MHSNIYQITTKPLDKEDYLNVSNLDNINTEDFADWYSEMDEDEQEEQLARLDETLEGVFYREGRVLTYVGAKNFVHEWRQAIVKLALTLTDENFASWHVRYDLRHIATDTHLKSSYRILGYDGGEYPEPFGDFITWSYANLQPGDKLYIGGVLDYHY